MIGVFGGTFDPIHFGHLRCALEVLEQLGLKEVRMIPCFVPPHRDVPSASAIQRAHMVELALADQARLKLDVRELDRAGPSYMVDTLDSLRAEIGERPLCLILGGDAFTGLPTWSRWQRLIELAHIVVMRRPGWTVPGGGEIGTLVREHFTEDIDCVRVSAAGCVVFVDVTQLEISATGIRGLLAAGRSARYLLPEVVLEDIHDQRLYVN